MNLLKTGSMFLIAGASMFAPGCSSKNKDVVTPTYGQINLTAKSISIDGTGDKDVSSVSIKFTNGQSAYLTNAHVGPDDASAAAKLSISDMSTDQTVLSANPSTNEFIDAAPLATPSNLVLTIKDPALQKTFGASSIAITQLNTQTVYATEDKVKQFTTDAQKTVHFPMGRAFIQGKNTTINSTGFQLAQ